MYVHNLRQANKRAEDSAEQSHSSVSSYGSADIVSPSARSSSVGSSSDDGCKFTGCDSSPIPYKRQVLSPSVHPGFSPVTPATPDLMDIDLDDLGDIGDVTHGWPSPGPLSPLSLKGKGKGNDDFELSGKDLIGKGKGQKGRGTGVKDSEEQPEVSSKPSFRRGKNLAVLARLEKAEELDFSAKPRSQKDQDNVISSSDASSSIKVPNEKMLPPRKRIGPTSPLSGQQESKQDHDNIKTIDEKILQEIQSTQHPEANKVLAEADASELAELAKTFYKSTTEQELTESVTRALNLTIGSQVSWCVVPQIQCTEKEMYRVRISQCPANVKQANLCCIKK